MLLNLNDKTPIALHFPEDSRSLMEQVVVREHVNPEVLQAMIQEAMAAAQPTVAIPETPVAPEMPTPIVFPEIDLKLADFESRLSDVCEFANKAVPMLCETMQDYEGQLIRQRQKHDEATEVTKRLGNHAENLRLAMGEIEEKIEAKKARIAKLESDVSTLCTLIDDREAEILAYVKKHAIIFAVSCAVFFASGGAAVYLLRSYL